MSTRRRIVISLVSIQLVLLLLGLVLIALDLSILGYLTFASAVMVVTLSLVVIWRRVTMQTVSMQEDLRRLSDGEQGKAAPQPGSDFLIGRAAGVRQPVGTSYVEQERLLFGSMTSWESLHASEGERSVIAVVGGKDRFDRALPKHWAADVELIPGLLEAQADQHQPQLIFGESSSFSFTPWRTAVDAAGTWIIQDLQRLRAWADKRGALLVFFDQGDLPIGVNTDVIRQLFHFVVSSKSGATGPDGAPMPASLIELYRLGSLLAEKK